MENNKNIIIMIIVIVIIVIGNTITNSKKEADFKHKLEMQKKADAKVIDELLAEKNKQSNIEILGYNANVAAEDAKKQLENISGLEEEIKQSQSKYEFDLLTQRCYQSQIDRLINGLEYNLDYCKIKDNLEQFRIKKY